MKTIHHIHFVGIKGVGMAPLAIIAKEAGLQVTGSDVSDAFITDSILLAKAIKPFIGFDPLHVAGADLVITTGAHGGYDNIEVQEAKKRGIPLLTQGEAVGEFMKGSLFDISPIGISVAGTHGKTTTTAMIAHILNFAQLDPSWMIGTSDIPSLGMSGHFGKGKYFIAEADEYATEPQYDKTPKFLWQHPQFLVITNIEHDHPDVYPTITDVRKAFFSFAKQVSKKGTLIVCSDDWEVHKMLKDFSGHVFTYGFQKGNTYQLQNIVKSEKGIKWEIVAGDMRIPLMLSLPGEHNALNATAAYGIATQLSIPDTVIQNALLEFTGTKRRLEYIGQLSSGAFVYDDYAHHPTEIAKTLTAIKEKYPNKKIVCIFQPHTYSRTKLLFDQFIDSLSLADVVVLTDIYASKREAFDSSVSSGMIVEKLQKKTQAALAKKLDDVIKYVRMHRFGDNYVILTMGAGDIYQIANTLLEHESVPRLSL